VTKEDFLKSKQDVEEILVLFRDFVAQQRPQLDIESVATGETWFVSLSKYYGSALAIRPAMNSTMHRCTNLHLLTWHIQTSSGNGSFGEKAL